MDHASKLPREFACFALIALRSLAGPEPLDIQVADVPRLNQDLLERRGLAGSFEFRQTRKVAGRDDVGNIERRAEDAQGIPAVGSGNLRESHGTPQTLAQLP